VSSHQIEKERAETLKTLDEFLKGIGYLAESVKGEIHNNE